MKNFEIKFYTNSEAYIDSTSINNSNYKINSGRIVIRDNENILMDKFYTSILQGINIFFDCINDLIEFKSIEFGVSEIINEDYNFEDAEILKFEENNINEIRLSFHNKVILVDKKLFLMNFFNELLGFYSTIDSSKLSDKIKKININRLLFYREKMNITSSNGHTN